jgi:hypothetical protein
VLVALKLRYRLQHFGGRQQTSEAPTIYLAYGVYESYEACEACEACAARGCYWCVIT